jgi:hypothetical protein
VEHAGQSENAVLAVTALQLEHLPTVMTNDLSAHFAQSSALAREGAINTAARTNANVTAQPEWNRFITHLHACIDRPKWASVHNLLEPLGVIGIDFSGRFRV